MTEPTKETVVIGSFDITINMPPPNGGQLAFHGYIYNSDTTEVLNARIDQMQDMATRQSDRQGIAMRVLERAKHIDNLERVLQIYDDLVEKKKQGVKFNSQQKQQYEAGETTIKAAREQIKKIDDGIAEAKARIGAT